jgi:hypothetical protein
LLLSATLLRFSNELPVYTASTLSSLSPESQVSKLAWPVCGSGELLPLAIEHGLAGCHSCGSAFDGAIVGTLKQVVGLPDALGEHACEECGHPEMRCLPDGVFYCPACGSEVLPLEARFTRTAHTGRIMGKGETS